MLIDPISLITHGYLSSANNIQTYIKNRLMFRIRQDKENIRLEISQNQKLRLKIEQDKLRFLIPRKNIIIKTPTTKLRF